MSGILLPALLIIAGLITAIATYRGIRRGGARFYTLEREQILRRAGLTLMASVAFFVAAIALLFYQRQQLLDIINPPVDSALEESEEQDVGQPAGTPFVEQFPPTPTPTSSAPVPTETPTPAICRGVVEGTFGNGLRMRDAPQGAEVSILPEGTLLTILDDTPVATGDITWRKVRAVGGDEGWVADEFLTMRGACGE